MSVRCSKELVQLLSIQLTIAKNFGKKPWANCFARVNRDNCCSPVSALKEMVTTLHPRDVKASFDEGGDKRFASKAGKRGHVSTLMRWTPTKSRFSGVWP